MTEPTVAFDESEANRLTQQAREAQAHARPVLVELMRADASIRDFLLAAGLEDVNDYSDQPEILRNLVHEHSRIPSSQAIKAVFHNVLDD